MPLGVGFHRRPFGYISASRGAREDLRPVLECSICALLNYSAFDEQSQRWKPAFSVKRPFGEPSTYMSVRWKPVSVKTHFGEYPLRWKPTSPSTFIIQCTACPLPCSEITFHAVHHLRFYPVHVHSQAVQCSPWSAWTVAWCACTVPCSACIRPDIVCTPSCSAC